MKLSDWCKENGLSYQTGWNMFKAGKLQHARQLPTGTILVNEPKVADKKEFNVVYARVSSSEQAKTNLITQAERVSKFIENSGKTVNLVIKEVGSGMNDNRKQLLKILNDDRVTSIYVEHKDRLTRFGYEYIKLLCEHKGIELIILNETETDEQDLIQDFVSIITSYCARLYGLRRSKRKTEQLLKELQID